MQRINILQDKIYLFTDYQKINIILSLINKTFQLGERMDQIYTPVTESQQIEYAKFQKEFIYRKALEMTVHPFEGNLDDHGFLSYEEF